LEKDQDIIKQDKINEALNSKINQIEEMKKKMQETMSEYNKDPNSFDKLEDRIK
jgi:DNA repair ATPase RecN